MIQAIILCVVVCALVIWGFWYLVKSAHKLHLELDCIKVEAEEAKTKEELQLSYDHLKEVGQKCWHRSLMERVMEIRTIIQTKYTLYGYNIQKTSFVDSGDNRINIENLFNKI